METKNFLYNSAVSWLIQNKEWVFSGIGVATIVAIIAVIKKFFFNRSPALLNAQTKAKHEERLFHKQKLREQELQAQHQKHIEPHLQPFVIFEATHDNLQVKNIGDDTTINIRVGDFKLNSIGMIANFPGSVPALLKGECIPLKEKKLLVGGEVMQGSNTDFWFSILKPLRTRIAKPAKIDFRPEITVEFQNIKGQGYFVKERLVYGEMEIIDSGML